jgi:hypothetical protein
MIVRLYDSLADVAVAYTDEVVRGITPEISGAARATLIGHA